MEHERRPEEERKGANGPNTETDHRRLQASDQAVE
jgi:hypothetical protein